MQEAILAVVQFGFLIKKYHRIEANVATQNIASIKLLEKSGFVREGTKRQSLILGNSYLDAFHYALLVSG